MASERILTLQQELFLASYTNPKSPTFSNALQSGLKAGYSQEYSESITAQLPDWLSENLGDMKLLAKAEKVLNETLEVEHLVPKIGMFGPIKHPETHEQIMEVDSHILKVKQDTAKFVAETVGKRRYSKKSPLEGDDGKSLVQVNLINYGENQSKPSA